MTQKGGVDSNIKTIYLITKNLVILQRSHIGSG